MNKILIIKHKESYGNMTADTRMKIAKGIADVWNETGIIAIPSGWDYKLEDCDKFMGVKIDKDIYNVEPPSIRVSSDMAEILKGNCIQLDDGRIIPGVRSVTFSKPEFSTPTKE